MGRAEQNERIEVLQPIAPHAPVQASRQAAAVARDEGAEHIALRHDRSRVDGGHERLVGGAQAIVVLDRYDALSSDGPREDDRAAARCQHRLTNGSSEVDPSVARPERVFRRSERHEHEGRRAQGPGIPEVGHGRPAIERRPDAARVRRSPWRGARTGRARSGFARRWCRRGDGRAWPGHSRRARR